MTFTTAAFDRSSSWRFEAFPYRTAPKGPPSSLVQHWRSRTFLTQHHPRFAKISLGVARRVVQRDKHLPMAALMFTHVILDDGVAAGEPMLVPQPIKNPLGRVTLLAVLASVIAQPLLDDLGEPVQLRPLDRRRPPIPRRYRKTQHLLHALARNPKVARRLARTHPVPYGETNLQIQFHGENAPALPDARKGKSGRVLLRRQRDYPAATVADFSTAVLTRLRAGPNLLVMGVIRSFARLSLPMPRSTPC